MMTSYRIRRYNAAATYAPALTLLGMVAMTLWPRFAAADPDGTQGPQRVANAEAVAECGFAPVAFMGNCTAVLAHPEIILYAQHCGRARSISLTHKSGAGRKLEFEFCKLFPGSWSMPKDFAFCKLKKPVTDIPPIPIAFGCELDNIKAGSPIIHCGFGNSGASGGFGTKRWGENTIGRISMGSEYRSINTSPNKVVSCQGDSGGPLLVKMKDDTWRTIGVASTISGSCGSPTASNVYAWAPAAVAWLEKESGVDVTPCFDPDGSWNPTKECGSFYKGDHKGHGTWADGCKGTPVSGYSSLCGPAFDGSEGGSEGGSEDDAEDDDSGEKDKGAPEVEILAPKDGQAFAPGKTIKVKVEATDDDKIASVEILLDGKSVDTQKEEPYHFELEDLEAGSYTLVAIATDKKKNTAKSDKISFTVEDDDESGDDTSTGEDSAENGDSGDDEDSDSAGDEDSTQNQDQDQDQSSSKAQATGAKPGGCGCHSSLGSTPLQAGLTFLLGLWGLIARKTARGRKLA